MVKLRTDYILLLIDVKDSTRLPNKEISGKMKAVEKLINGLNKEFKTQFALPLNISYGDEIAGLLRSPKYLYTIINAIRKLFYPLTEIRFAVVKGRIAVASNDIRKVGGSVFKEANNAINTLKEKGGFCYWHLGNTVTDQCLTSLCEISNALLLDMSRYQRDVFDLLRNGHTQKEIANKLHKYPQSVYDAIQRSKAPHVMNAEKTVHLALAQHK